MIDVAIQVAPVEVIAQVIEPVINVITITITPDVRIVRVPLVATLISIADCSLSAIPNPIRAEEGVLAMAA